MKQQDYAALNSKVGQLCAQAGITTSFLDDQDMRNAMRCRLIVGLVDDYGMSFEEAVDTVIGEGAYTALAKQVCASAKNNVF